MVRRYNSRSHSLSALPTLESRLTSLTLNPKLFFFRKRVDIVLKWFGRRNFSLNKRVQVEINICADFELSLICLLQPQKWRGTSLSLGSTQRLSNGPPVIWPQKQQQQGRQSPAMQGVAHRADAISQIAVNLSPLTPLPIIFSFVPALCIYGSDRSTQH